MLPIKPYANEAESLAIGDLTIENRIDQVELYGSIQLTRDKAGLEQARQLKQLLDAVVATLEEDKNLPEKISFKPTDKVDNPFK
jgi:hypothetical protein